MGKAEKLPRNPGSVNDSDVWGVATDDAMARLADRQAATGEAASSKNEGFEASIHRIKEQVLPRLLERVDPEAAATLSKEELSEEFRPIIMEVLTELKVTLNRREQFALEKVLVDELLGLGPLLRFVDPHVHLRTPGREDEEDIASGTRAAAAGGYCALLAMANTDPVVDSAAVLGSLLERAQAEAEIPVGVEPDDLPDDLAGVVTRPTWLVEIHLPGGSPR